MPSARTKAAEICGNWRGAKRFISPDPDGHSRSFESKKGASAI
jgi:hypothetical protein